MKAAAKRRTQEERSADTRERLLSATISCLVERGYANTTTTSVGELAGVSRGAQLHHYRTREELVLAAVEYLFDKRTSEFMEAFARIPRGADRAKAGIDLLWKIIGSEPFYAWLELAVAGRTDKVLGKRVKELGLRTSLQVEQLFRQIFPPPDDLNPFYELAPRFTFTLLQGLALDRLLVPQSRHAAADIVQALKLLSTFAFPGGNP